MHGGRHVRVNFSNIKDYINRTIEVRLTECKKQIKAIKKGIDKTFDSSILRLLSWSDLEYKVVGKEVLDMERLKEITIYRVRKINYFYNVNYYRIVLIHQILSKSSGKLWMHSQMKKECFIWNSYGAELDSP